MISTYCVQTKLLKRESILTRTSFASRDTPITTTTTILHENERRNVRFPHSTSSPEQINSTSISKTRRFSSRKSFNLLIESSWTTSFWWSVLPLDFSLRFATIVRFSRSELSSQQTHSTVSNFFEKTKMFQQLRIQLSLICYFKNALNCDNGVTKSHSQTELQMTNFSHSERSQNLTQNFNHPNAQMTHACRDQCCKNNIWWRIILRIKWAWKMETCILLDGVSVHQRWGLQWPIL